MTESIKQKKIASVVKEEMSRLFQKKNLSTWKGGMVTITNVSITPDLLIARIHLSLFQVKDTEELMKELNDNKHEMRHQLGNTMRNQVRRIPEIEYYIDDSLDKVFRLEEIFRDITK